MRYLTLASLTSDDTSVTDTSENAHIVAIGGSAGGLEAIRDLLKNLPREFSASIVVALHSPPESQLTELLQRHCSQRIRRLRDVDRLDPGTVHIVPGGRHAVFNGDQIELSDVVEDSGFRPSIDALFMTMATRYKSRCIAVVLSGAMDDGTRGAQVIYDLGGYTVVQDPDDAAHSSMPLKVIHLDHPQRILPAKDLGAWLGHLIA